MGTIIVGILVAVAALYYAWPMILIMVLSAIVYGKILYSGIAIGATLNGIWLSYLKYRGTR